MTATSTARTFSGRTAVVTGGGGGIGTEICIELGRRGATVVLVDPGVDVRGNLTDPYAAERTAERLRVLGMPVTAAALSVRDRASVHDLFADVVSEHGSLDIVVNTAGVLRPRGLVSWHEDDWTTVVGVHFDGYRNVIAEALPIMAAAGYGRIVGFTSGAGLARTSAVDVCYSSAKRTVASLTWAIGGLLPAGVTVNCLSPIAGTRMTVEALRATSAGKGALDLTAMPRPGDMAPAAAYLASEASGWCSGRILFSAGSELSLISPPRLVEAVRTTTAGDYGQALDTLVPVVLAPTERRQASGGGSNPRFHDVFSSHADSVINAAPPGISSCVVVGDSELCGYLNGALARWSTVAVELGKGRCDLTSHDFERNSTALLEAGLGQPSLRAVVIALPPGGQAAPRQPAGTWQEVLDEHETVTGRLLRYASWVTAAIGIQRATGREVRVLAVVDGDSAGDNTVYQGVVQMARSFNSVLPASEVRIAAVSRPALRTSGQQAFAHLAARMVSAEDTLELAGAELIWHGDWLGLESHPAPVSTVSIGGTELPMWFDEVLRESARV